MTTFLRRMGFKNSKIKNTDVVSHHPIPNYQSRPYSSASQRQSVGSDDFEKVSASHVVSHHPISNYQSRPYSSASQRQSLESDDFERVPTSHSRRSYSRCGHRKEEDPFKHMEFDDDNELRREEMRHQQKMKSLDEEYERRMRGLETVRKRKMEDAYSGYFQHRSPSRSKSRLSGIYGSSSEYAGLCLIVQNSEKHNKSAEILKNLFKQFGYRVNLKRNLSETKMLTLLQYTSQEEFEHYGSFVSFFLCKGTDKYLETADKKQLDIQTIVEIFNPREVKDLEGKPKMFYFQSDVDIFQPKQLWKETNHGQSSIVNYTDAFVLRSTQRDFMKNFTNVLENHKSMPLSQILTTVAKYTMPLASNKEKYEIISTLSREVYFGKTDMGNDSWNGNL